MPQPTLQKQFKGLSDFAGLYTLGVQPMQLSNVIAPTIDISLFLEPIRYATSTTNATLQNKGNGAYGAFEVVPDGELWLVHHFGCLGLANSPAITEGYPAYQLPNGIVTTLTTHWPDSFNGQKFHVDFYFSNPFPISAGMSVGVQMQLNTTAGSPLMSTTVAYQKVKV